MNNLIATIDKHINPNIKVGDVVRVIDGSGLLLVRTGQKIDRPFNYPELLHTKEVVSNILFTVKHIGIENKISNYLSNVTGIVYLLDTIIQCNGVELYTCSKFVTTNIN